MVKGDLVKTIGIIKNFESNCLVIKPTNLEGFTDELLIEKDCCAKYFGLGDAVIVNEGKYKGESGMVMAVDHDQVNLPLVKINSSQIEVRLNTQCLHLKS